MNKISAPFSPAVWTENIHCGIKGKNKPFLSCTWLAFLLESCKGINTVLFFFARLLDFVPSANFIKCFYGFDEISLLVKNLSFFTMCVLAPQSTNSYWLVIIVNLKGIKNLESIQIVTPRCWVDQCLPFSLLTTNTIVVVEDLQWLHHPFSFSFQQSAVLWSAVPQLKQVKLLGFFQLTVFITLSSLYICVTTTTVILPMINSS